MSGFENTLAAEPAAPLFLAAESVTDRGQILADANQLAEGLRKAAAQRLLVQTANAERVVTAVCACQRWGVDLVLAHATLPRETIGRLCHELNVDATWEDGHRGLHPQKPVQADTSDPTRSQATGDRRSGSVFILTSGTTGMPKVAKHRFDRLVGRVASSASVDGNRAGRWLLTYQPTAFAGLQVLLTACLTHGAIIVPVERTPSGFAAAAERHQATHISGTPTFWRSFLMAVDPQRLTSLRQITLGGEAVDQATLDRLAIAFPAARRTHIYASTEAGAVFAVSDGRAGFPLAWLDGEVQGVQLRVCSGELEVLSPRQMVGYSSDAQDDSAARADGWLKTGDLVRVDGDRVFFLGRDDAQINVGGSKVYPHEVESYLLTLPGIIEARVRGVASPISGQVVVAEIVARPDLDKPTLVREVTAACRKDLPRFQVPGLIKIVERIEVAESGKKVVDLATRRADGMRNA